MATEERHDVMSTGTTSAPEKIKETASNRVRTELDTRSTQAADQITPYAEALRKAGQHLESQGSTSGGQAAGRMADGVQQVSDYMRRSDADQFLGDVEGFVRRRPWAAGGIGAALGFMGARFLKASAETRYSSSTRDMPLSRETNQTTAGGW